MRLSIPLLIVGIAASVAAVLIAGTLLINPDRPLLVKAGFNVEAISPNADGVDDVTIFNYEISENARVSLTFADDSGQTYVFREDQERAPGRWRVAFSGVVRGYTLPGETIAGDVERRLMPDGTYTWTFTVEANDSDAVATATGTLTLTDGDTELPDITEFTLSPTRFTPNQDGIDDRVQVNLFLEKAVDDLTVDLEEEDGSRSFIPPRQGCREDTDDPGRFCFDYDGGVTGGAAPPDDGIYTVIAEAQDAGGQRVRRTGELIIDEGGVPFAEIVAPSTGATVAFVPQSYEDRFYMDVDTEGDLLAFPDDPAMLNELPVTLQVGDVLVFALTVTNYGQSPIRTTAGPWPGTVYQQNQNRGAMGATEQSGAWRVGIQCETSAESYPYRWSVGSPDDLVQVEDPRNGNTYYYLPPGETATVWGGIRLTDIAETRNPQACWAGLIHEDVAISVRNTDVGRRQITLVGLAQSASSADN